MRWSASRYPHINTSLPIPLTLMRRDPLPPSPPLCVNNLVLNTDYKRKHIEANQFYYTKYFLKHLKWRGYIYNMPRLRLAGRKGEGGTFMVVRVRCSRAVSGEHLPHCYLINPIIFFFGSCIFFNR